MTKIASLLLLIAGALLTAPSLYTYVTDLTGGTPIIQISVGIASVLVGLVLLGKGEPIASTTA